MDFQHLFANRDPVSTNAYPKLSRNDLLDLVLVQDAADYLRSKLLLRAVALSRQQYQMNSLADALISSPKEAPRPQSVKSSVKTPITQPRRYPEQSEQADVPYSDPHAKANFPRVLMDILSEKRSRGIIEWLPCGERFVIIDKTSFSKEILPLYFGKVKLPSFSRKLNRWGFLFDRKTGTYSHPYFLKSNPRLVQQMYTREGKVRKMEKRNLAKKAGLSAKK